MEKIKLVMGLLILLLLSSSCTSQIMNKQTYSQIAIGMSTEEICSIAGQPYRIIEDQSCQNYEYIERFDIGPNITNHNVYTLTIHNGVVVDKQTSNTTPRMNLSTP